MRAIDTIKLFCRLQGKIPAVENIVLPNQTTDEINAQLNLETKTVAELLDLNIYDNEVGTACLYIYIYIYIYLGLCGCSVLIH